MKMRAPRCCLGRELKNTRSSMWILFHHMELFSYGSRMLLFGLQHFAVLYLFMAGDAAGIRSVYSRFRF